MNPICPHCKAPLSNPREKLDMHESAHQEVECSKCGEPYLVTVSIEISYESQPIEEEEDDDATL